MQAIVFFAGPAQQDSTTDQLLDWLRRSYVEQVTIVRDRELVDGQQSTDHAGMPGIPPISFVLQHPQGSAATIRRLGSASFDDTFAVLCWPLEFDVDLAALLDYHRARNALVTIALHTIDDPATHLMVTCDSTGKVTRLVQEPDGWQHDQRTAAVGLYLVEPAVLTRIPEAREFDWEAHLLPLLVAEGEAVFAQLADGLSAGRA